MGTSVQVAPLGNAQRGLELLLFTSEERNPLFVYIVISSGNGNQGLRQEVGTLRDTGYSDRDDPADIQVWSCSAERLVLTDDLVGTMMEFITGGSLSNALAPRLEVGQDALYDALRARDVKRATRIIKRVASAESHHGSRAAGGNTNGRRVPEADLNAPDARGLRPIHLAAIGGMSDSVVALIAAGVPVDAMGVEGNTALHLAAFHGQDGVVAVLMGAGASPNQDNVKGKTAVDLAKSETTLTLLCPLHYAAGAGMLDNLVSLVAKGVSVKSLGRGKETPLHAAAATGNADAARLLLARGADPLRGNASKETPLDLARRFGYAEVAEVLEKAAEQAEAAAAVIQAEKAATDAKDAYHEQEAVVYMRDGEGHPAVVMKVHHDDDEPYYTVKVLATGRERQTDANHLVRRSAPRTSGGEHQGAGRRETSVGDGEAASGVGSRSASSSKRNREAERERGAGEWGNASALFLDVASELTGGRAAVSSSDSSRDGKISAKDTPSGGHHSSSSSASVGGSSSKSLSLALASAFSAVPAAETRAILLGKLREMEAKGKAVAAGGDGSGSSPVGAVGGAMDDDRGVRGRVGRGGETEEGEGVARAMADACRDIVLKCLLGEASAVGVGSSPKGVGDGKRPA